MFCGAAAHSVPLRRDLQDEGRNYGAEARADLHFYFKCEYFPGAGELFLDAGSRESLSSFLFYGATLPGNLNYNYKQTRRLNAQ